MQKRTAAVLRSLGAVVCWSVAPILIRATRDHFSVLFQTFARYLASMAVIWPVLIASRGPGGLRRDLAVMVPLLPRLLVIALVNYVFQVGYTVSYYTLEPGFAALVGQSGVLFAAFLALVYLRDERSILTNRVYQAGLAGAVAGVCLTILGGGRGAGGAGALWPGVPAMLASAFSWALLGALVKKWLHSVNPMLGVSLVFTLVTPMFLVTELARVGSIAPPAAPPGAWVVLILSGLIGVGLGHTLYYSSVPIVGVTTASSLGLLLPFLAGIGSLIVFGERMGALQLAGGALLLAGCYLVITRSRPSAPLPRDRGRSHPAS